MRARFLYRVDNGFIVNAKPYGEKEDIKLHKDQKAYEKLVGARLSAGEFRKKNGVLLMCDPDPKTLSFYPHRKDFIRGA